MPTMELGGVTVTLDAAGLAVAQRWQNPLNAAASQLVSAGQGADPKVRQALSASALPPVVEGLVATVQGVEGLFQSLAIPNQPSGPLASAVQGICARYGLGVLQGVDRAVAHWAALGPLFFRRGDGPSREAFALDQLTGLAPQSDALDQGGIPTLRMRFVLKRVEGTGPGDAQPQADLIYVPRDVEGDALVVGNTSRWCKSGGEYRPVEGPCGHPWCRSLSETLNAQLGDADALPTLRVWPAVPGSALAGVGTEAYGFREPIRSGLPEDVQVSSAQSPEAATFYRILGRQLALAYGLGVPGFDIRDFAIHQRRPYWIATPCLFDGPFRSLADTGAFEIGVGPLAPPARDSVGSPIFTFGLQVAPSEGATAPVPIPASDHAQDVIRGCREGLEALGALATPVGDRLRLGPDVWTWYRPRSKADQLARQSSLLEALSTLSGSADWDALDATVSAWQQSDREAWSGYWLSKALDAVLTRKAVLAQPVPAALQEALAPWTDRVAALAGVQTFDLVTPDLLLALDVPDRIQAWDALTAAATLLAGFQGEEGWDPKVEGPEAPSPSYALPAFELAEHLRAQVPYFVRKLQDTGLWSAETGEELRLDPATAPPPRLQRRSYFARAGAEGIAGQWQRLQNVGQQLRLTAGIPAAMGG